MKNKLTIGLLSHYFQDTNLGCSALSICNLMMLDKAAEQLNISLNYIILVNEKQPHVELSFTESKYEYRVFPSTKQLIKRPFYTFNTNIFDGCDLVFNLCAGDGFTDIYGKWRTFSESYMVLAGARKGKRIILSPQTIGPFSDKFCIQLAKRMMNKCSDIFVRDHMSYELCTEMGQGDKTQEVIDVALALPYQRTKLGSGKHAGMNVSGLLFNDETNRFGLSINYKEFVIKSVRYLQENGYTVHLIPHVILHEETGEDDYIACKSVHEINPTTILATRFNSPIDAKGYIAGLDLFIGARMHATIAAISSGVPVIPIAYSRKVNGLYGNLNYPYYIDAKDSTINTDDAVNQIKQFNDKIDEMKTKVIESNAIYSRYLNTYSESLIRIFKEELEKKE